MPMPSDIADQFIDEDLTTDDDTNVDDNVEDSTTDDDSMDNVNTDDSTDDTNDDDTANDDSTDDDDGYFADDSDADDDATVDTPVVPPSFSAEDKYIIDNLPLISVRLVMNDDSVKTVQVRSAAELPADAKGYASFKEGELFKEATTAQEIKARELQSYYRQHQSTLQTQEYEKKENQGIRDDIAELQRDGEIPKFKAQPGTRAFENDPAAKVVQEVIDFMNERNDKYLEQSKSGRNYKHIGFAEAFELMNGKSSQVDKNSKSRKDAATKLKSRQGGSTVSKGKAPVSGRTLQDVAREFDTFEV